MTGAIDGMPALVSVVIPHFNQVTAAARCLQSLREQSWPVEQTEVILVDNGSIQDLAPLRSAFPEVTFLVETQAGPGPARNLGARTARGSLLAFIDADCRADPDWLRQAVAALAAPDSTGVVGGDVRIDFVDPARPTALEGYEAVFAFRQREYIDKMRFSGTGNLAVVADVWAQVGPFGGIGIAEDRDWGQRAAAAGHPARYVPGMVVYHPARAAFADLESKWRRHIAHDRAGPRGRSRLRWLGLTAATLLSAIPHGVRLLVSSRLPGWRGRMGGLAVLFRIRAFRALEMLRVAGGADTSGDWSR
ncbi:glycosyltransferase [Sphingomonas flavalba]|uniref:glycosyltransferase n=1 Tax=Sphingomonas flavalba TaxID=2559804 RepID=UPI0019D01FF1|nr:glycosyltransferase family 2 protein [Sphingomonas flavalba]